MRASFVFGNKLGTESNELYEVSYITYFLCDLLYKKQLKKEDITAKLEDNINGKIILGRFLPFINSLFNETYGYYSLKEEQHKFIEKTHSFKEDLFILEWEQNSELYKKIGDCVNENHFDINKALTYALSLDKIENKKANKFLLSTYFDLISNQDKYLLKLDTAIVNIDDKYKDISLKVIIENKTILSLLFANGLFTIGDLSSVSVESVFLLVSIDYYKTLSSIMQLKENNEAAFKEELINIFEGDLLAKREKDIISRRNGFEGKSFTLEEVGNNYELTRERCRQIETKATLKIVSRGKKIKNSILLLFYILTTASERRYVSVDKFEKYFGDSKLTKYLLFIIDNSNLSLDLRHDEKLNIVYNPSLTSLNDLSNEVIDAYGPFLFKTDYDALNKFEQSVVETSYREYYPNFYLQKGFTSKELFGMMIDEIFPNGYRIGNDQDRDLLISKYQERYHTDDAPSAHSIEGFLDRLNYCQIGKGTYKNRELCPQLPQDLIDAMVNYILINGPTVYYQSIFEHFKSQLQELDINNYFYLKGLLDIHLPSDLNTKRNYVTVGKVAMTGYESMLQFIKSFNGKFSIIDLRQKYPGVKDYTFYNLLINETENGLIWLADKNFIYINKVIVSESSIKELKKFIDDLFVQMNVETTSSRKIFARLTLTNKTLLESLKLATDSFSIFSLIKYWFKDEYGFNRPLISKSKDINVTTYSLIANYANSLDSFNQKTILHYCSKMNILGLNSYLSFMEDMSDSFVQINIDTMYKKEKFEITDDQLKDFKLMLDLIFSRFASIDTRHFNGYQMLASISYHWNKYLLVGVIRSFFQEEYEIENTETTYDSTDFIIRRGK